jgi:hypothetical protein
MAHEPTTGPYPEPHESSPSTHILFPEVILSSSHLCLGLPTGLFLSSFLTKICTHFSSDNAVDIATAYELDGRRVGVPVPVGARFFSTPHHPDLRGKATEA